MTQDNAMDVSPSWQELDAWREAVLETWEKMPDRPSPGDLMALGNVVRSSPDYTARRNQARVSALEAERDIALANLSAIRLALDAVRAAHTDDGADSAVANLERIIMNDAAPEHMRRLKAQWQAEALEDVANYLQHGEGKGSVNPPVSIRGRAIRLRRHAEEGDT